MNDHTSAATEAAGLRVSEVRLQDLRAIGDLCVPLGELTILVGENNVGKTTFLRALDLAIGNARSDDDDFHVSEGGERSASFVVDLRLSPVAGSEFNEALSVTLGDAVRLPPDGPQYVTLRTTGTVSADGSGPNIERRFVDGWASDRKGAMELRLLDRPRSDHLELLSFFLLDARRDLVEEFRQRRSYWGRLMADVGIPAEERSSLERSLKALGDELVAKSGVLAAVRSDLERVTEALGAAVSAVSVEALPGRIEEVARAIDVLLKAPGSAPLPLRVQGMGARSLAVVMVFQAFTRLRLGREQDIPPLPFAAFEEPEAHLHPQAQRAMFHLIKKLPGQKIISTHSPYVTQVADVFDIRAFTRQGASISCKFVSQTKPDGAPTFTADALGKLRRFVQRNNGEVAPAPCCW